jgi:hypothetical protein
LRESKIVANDLLQHPGMPSAPLFLARHDNHPTERSATTSMRVAVMQTLAAVFFVVLGIAQIAVSARSLSAQQVDITAPPTRPEIRHPENQDKGRGRGAGQGEPYFISPLSVKTDTGRVGIAAWTSPNTTVVSGHSLSGEGAGSVGFGVAAEWGARQNSDWQRVR